MPVYKITITAKEEQVEEILKRYKFDFKGVCNYWANGPRTIKNNSSKIDEINGRTSLRLVFPQYPKYMGVMEEAGITSGKNTSINPAGLENILKGICK